MNVLQFISIVIEIGIVILGFMIAQEKKKTYGWFIVLTFGIYTFYDLANLFSLEISSSILRLLFFIATISIFSAVWQIYKKK